MQTIGRRKYSLYIYTHMYVESSIEHKMTKSKIKVKCHMQFLSNKLDLFFIMYTHIMNNDNKMLRTNYAV